MSGQYANVTVSHKMHGDRRFDLLAQLAGWSRPEACWRMVELWARCTALQTDLAPTAEIRIHLGPRGDELLLEAMLGERLPDGSLRVLGGGLSGGDTDRFGWYTPHREQNREAGVKRAKKAVRGPGGRFLAGTSGSSARSSAGPAESSAAGQDVIVTTEDRTLEPPLEALDQRSPAPLEVAGPAEPADRQRHPASGFRIPDQKDLPPARAIPPSTDQAPAAVLWQELEQARAAAAAELGVQAQPLTAFDVGQEDLTRMLSGARRRGQAELDKLIGQARHVIAMARQETTSGEKPFDWFTGVVFQPNNFRRLAGKTQTPTVRAPPRRSAGRADRDQFQQHQPPRKTTIL